MSFLNDFFKTRFLEKAQKPYSLRLDFMNEFREIAVQETMTTFVYKEAESPEHIHKQIQSLDKVIDIIIRLCPEFLILSRHWRTINKYKVLKNYWSKRELYQRYMRALRKNNYRYSMITDAQAIISKLIKTYLYPFFMITEPKNILAFDQAWEWIEKHILHEKSKHSIVSSEISKLLLAMIKPPELSDRELLISPDVALTINPFTDLFFVTAAQIIYTKAAYESYYNYLLHRVAKCKPYLNLGTVRLHLTDGINDYVVKEWLKTDSFKQQFYLSFKEIQDIIQKKKLTFFSNKASVYLDHENVKTNVIEQMIDVPEGLGIQPNDLFDKISFNVSTETYTEWYNKPEKKQIVENGIIWITEEFNYSLWDVEFPIMDAYVHFKNIKVTDDLIFIVQVYDKLKKPIKWSYVWFYYEGNKTIDVSPFEIKTADILKSELNKNLGLDHITFTCDENYDGRNHWDVVFKATVVYKKPYEELKKLGVV